MAISNLIAKEFDGQKDLSGIGGVETGADAAEFLLLGANSVQVLPLALQELGCCDLHPCIVALCQARQLGGMIWQFLLMCTEAVNRRTQSLQCQVL